MTTMRTAPQEWRRGGTERLAPLVFVLVLVLCVFGVVLGLASDELAGPQRVVMACFFGVSAVGMALAVAFARSPSRDGEVALVNVTLGSQEVRGVAFPMRARLAFFAFIGFVTVLCVAGTFFVVAGLVTGSVEVPAQGIVGLFFLILIAILLPYLCYRVVGARLWQPTAIVLTPTHLVSTWAHPDTAIPWDDVADIQPRAVSLGRLLELSKERIIVVTASDLTRVIGISDRARASSRTGAQRGLVIAVRSSGADPVLLLDALQYYLANPDKRSELAGADGLERIVAGNVPVAASA